MYRNTPQCKLVYDERGSFKAWSHLSTLEEMTDLQYQLSSGFLSGKIEGLFKGLELLWIPLFQAAKLEIEGVSVFQSIEQFESSSYQKYFFINGESAVFCSEDDTIGVIACALIPGLDSVAKDIVSEYLLRRFIGSLQRAWHGQEAIRIQYGDADKSQDVEIVGAVYIDIIVNGSAGRICIGMGPEATAFIDRMLQAQAKGNAGKVVRLGGLDRGTAIQIQVGQLIVSQEKSLLDYLTPGAVIDLGEGFCRRAFAYSSGRQVAGGSLFLYQGKWALRLDELESAESRAISGDSQIDLVLGVCNHNKSAAGSLLIGNIVLSDEEATTHINLTIGREVVAVGELGTMGDHFALRVLA